MCLEQKDHTYCLFTPKLCAWNRKITRENEILRHLPITLQTATAVSVHLPTLSKVTIFQNCEKSLLEQLVLKLTPQVRKQMAYLGPALHTWTTHLSGFTVNDLTLSRIVGSSKLIPELLS